MALLVEVGEDVGGIEQLNVRQITHRAALSVGLEHTLAKAVW